MTTWSYRLVRYRDGSGYGLHEVFYDARGRPWGMTAEAARFTAANEEGPSAVWDCLGKAYRDARDTIVFDEPETWPGTAPGSE